jgi:hypothetical protein
MKQPMGPHLGQINATLSREVTKMTTRSLSNKRVTPGDEVFHDALDRILEFGRENGKDHPVVMNTTVAILDALIHLSDIEERDAEAQRK